MKTLTEEQFKKQYGDSTSMKFDQLTQNRLGKSTMPSIAEKPIANKFTDAISLGGATDVFGSLLARQGIGTDTSKEVTRQYVEKPTGAQVAGAVAQTAAIPAGAFVTGGGSIWGQMAAGAGLGYLYDVGGNLAEGETDAGAFKPGVETAAGVALPPVLRGAGAGLRGVGTLLSRNAKNIPTSAVTDTVSNIGQAASDAVSPLKQTAREYAINRPNRLVERGREAIQEAQNVAKVYETAPAPVRNAIDAKLDMRLVNAISEADDATKAGYKQIVEIAETGSDKLGVKPRPEIVAGDAAADQYGILNAKRQEVGNKIGEAIDNLPSATYEARPLYDEVDSLLQNNGIQPVVSENGVALDFTGSNIPPKQRATIQSLYELLTETGDSITARQLYNKDRLLSQLQREARFDGVSDIMVKTPEGSDIDLFKALREVFTAELEGIAPSIRPLNKEYAQLRGLQDDIESTIFKSGNYQGTKDVDPAEFAQTNLRRLFSDAQSAADYRKIYDNLDAYSRALGYEGARADELAAFATEMRKLYPDSVPQTSATSIFGSTADKILSAVNLGKANVTDQQKALRGLLDVPEKYTPAQGAAELFGKKSLKQRTTEALKDTRGALNPQRMPKDNPFESLDYDTLTPKGEEVVKKFLNHIDGSEPLTDFDFEMLLEDVKTLAGRAGIEPELSNKEIAKKLADKYQAYVADWGSN